MQVIFVFQSIKVFDEIIKVQNFIFSKITYMNKWKKIQTKNSENHIFLRLVSKIS